MNFAQRCDKAKKILPYHGRGQGKGEFVPSLNFLANHIDLIMKGEKTQTSRYFLRGKYREGDTIFIDMYEPKVAQVKITKMEEKKLEDFTDADAKREGYSSMEGFKRIWTKLHEKWNPEDKVKVIQFKLLK
jgi:hypothetical protein